MSKTSKKLLKLLQNVALLCYNDYTINARVTTVIFVNKYLEGMISMKFIIVGRNIEVTPGLRAAVEEKIGKLDKYFNPDTEVHVTLSVEKDRQKIEVTIPVKGSIIRSEQVSNDMYVSIDLVEEIIERQLKKYGFFYNEVDYLAPVYHKKDSALIRCLMEAYQEVTGDMDTEPMDIGGATYARALPNAVAFGPLFPYEEELAHEANEFLSIESLQKMTEIFVKGLYKLMTEYR